MSYLLIGLAITIVIVFVVSSKKDKKSDSIAEPAINKETVATIAKSLELEASLVQAVEKLKKPVSKKVAKKAVKAKPTKTSTAKKTTKKKSSTK